MLVSEAKAELNKFDDDDHIGMMLVCEDEVRELCGTVYRKVDSVLNLLSRGSDRHFWYDKRDIFPELISDAYGLIERRKEEDRREKSNQQLQSELGLSTLIISVDHEVRPLLYIHPCEFTVTSLGLGTFQMPANSTYADLLRELDKRLLITGDNHVFYEGVTMNHKESQCQAHFGS